jgi:separase
VQFKCLIPESQKLLYDGPWSEEEKGAILEHILDILSTQENTSKAFIAFQAKIFQAALTIYDRKLYPVRRLRVLRHLVSLDHMQQQEVTANFTEELQLLQENFTIEGSRDEGLHGYLAHYNLLMMSLLELKNKHSSVEVIKNCIGIWSSMQERCKDLASLEREIDDIAHLLVHLQSLADFLQMKGFNMLVVSVLRLIADLNEFQVPSSNPNALAISFTRLGTQWLDLGYSGRAGLAFDRAESYGNQLGISPITLLQLYLAYSEYFLVIGNSSKR